MLDPHEPLSPGTSSAIGVGAVTLVLLAWSAVAGLDLVSSARLPAPWEVLHALVDLTHNPAREGSPLLEAVLASGSRILLAALLTVAVGVPVGTLMGASPRVNAALSPLVDPFRSAPIRAKGLPRSPRKRRALSGSSL